MSISEQVNNLRLSAAYKEHSLKVLLNEAADTIEALSAKLQAADMEQLADCGGWIYCGDGKNLPKAGKRYQVTAIWKDEDFEKRSVYDAVYGSDGQWHGEDYIPVPYEVVAWRLLPEPYHEP